MANGVLHDRIWRGYTRELSFFLSLFSLPPPTPFFSFSLSLWAGGQNSSVIGVAHTNLTTGGNLLVFFYSPFRLLSPLLTFFSFFAFDYGHTQGRSWVDHWLHLHAVHGVDAMPCDTGGRSHNGRLFVVEYGTDRCGFSRSRAGVARAFCLSDGALYTFRRNTLHEINQAHSLLFLGSIPSSDSSSFSSSFPRPP